MSGTKMKRMNSFQRQVFFYLTNVAVCQLTCCVVAKRLVLPDSVIKLANTSASWLAVVLEDNL